MSRPSPGIEKILGKEGLLSRSIPSFRFRQAQVDMAAAVEKTLQHGGVLLAEAGTGVGKTLAYLVPALLSGKRVVVSTGTKTLQDQIAHKEIPLLERCLGRSVSYSILKGRNNYLCLYRYDHPEPGFGSGREGSRVWEEISRWVPKTGTGDRSELTGLSDRSPLWKDLSVNGEQCLGSGCERFHDCFITRARQNAMKADLIIVNHHLFFADLALRGEPFSEILPPYEAVIFDEAHLIEEISGSFFGWSLSSYRIEELERDTRREFGILGIPPDRLGHGMNHLLERSGVFFGRLKEELKLDPGPLGEGFEAGEGSKRPWPGESISPRVQEAGEGLRRVLHQFEKDLSKGGDRSEGIRSLLGRAQKIGQDLAFFLNRDRDGFVSWVEARGRGVFFHSTPLDVSGILNASLFSAGGPVILTSATLSVDGSFEFLERGLGLKEVQKLRVDSPFDYPRQLAIYFPSHAVHPNSDFFTDWAADEILEILKQTRGRAFVLTTSYRHLDAFFERCLGHIDLPLLKQGDKPRHRLLEEFQSNLSSVLFATASFWQGVDVQGPSLSCVIIAKLPFASPGDPYTAGKIGYYQQSGEDPFRVYQLPKAVIQLKQGVGRLIRTEADRGVIALLDQRILNKPYGRRFLRSLPPSPQIREKREIGRFLNGESGGG